MANTVGTEFTSHGITPETPNGVVLGAGTIHKGLKYTPTYAVTADETAQPEKTYYERTGDGEPYTYTVKEVEPSGSVTGLYEVTGGSWNAKESILGATSGGNKLTIAPEFTDIEADGAMVKVQGLAVKTGETATLEVNLLEVTPENIKTIVIGKDDPSAPEGYSGVTSKAQIEKGDYIENFGFVGKRIDGQPIIIIFDAALCTSGMELDAKAKEAGVLPATFECYAPIEGDLESIPWHIYYPTPKA